MSKVPGAMSQVRRPADERMPVTDFELRFAVLTKTSGRVQIRYFAGPRDAEGVTMNLSPRERELLAHALAVPGFSAIARDDVPDLQGRLGL